MPSKPLAWLRRLLGGLALVVGLGVAAILVFATSRRAVFAVLRHPEAPSQLVVPVVGAAPRSLTGSFGEPRSGHRHHQGIDIFAPRGTPVVAAAAGEVVRVGQDRLGGNVVWVAGASASLYYYAHLDRFRTGLAVGEQVSAGRELGRVGTTGNAAGTPPHLHFAIYPLTRLFWPIDPAPLLRSQGHALPRPTG